MVAFAMKFVSKDRLCDDHGAQIVSFGQLDVLSDVCELEAELTVDKTYCCGGGLRMRRPLKARSVMRP